MGRWRYGAGFKIRRVLDPPQPDLFGKYFNGESGGWVDRDKTQLRIAKPAIKIGEMSLGNAGDWKRVPQSMTVMMYNKGTRAIDKDEFEKRLDRVREGLTASPQCSPGSIRPPGRRWWSRSMAGPGFGDKGRLPWKPIRRGRQGN